MSTKETALLLVAELKRLGLNVDGATFAAVEKFIEAIKGE